MSNQTQNTSKLEVTDEELEIARQAIEEELIWRRDNRVMEIRNNGLCVKEKDGTPNPMIRMGAETAIAIGLKAINKHRGVQ